MERRKHIVLLGGGHANCLVLKDLSEKLGNKIKITLTSEYDHTYYSGMLPGCVANFYKEEEISIDLKTLADYYGVDYVLQQTIGINLEKNQIVTKNGFQIDYDILVINIGSRTSNTLSTKGVKEYAIATRPINLLVEKLRNYEDNIKSDRDVLRIIISGSGAAGLELSMCLLHRWQSKFNKTIEITIIGGTPEVGQSYRPSMRKLINLTLERKGIKIINNSIIIEVGKDFVIYENQDKQRYTIEQVDKVIWATGAEAHDLLKDSGLEVDNKGFMYVNEYLQLEKYPNVLGAGDCINIKEYDNFPPKAGVYAVRAAPIISQNVQSILNLEEKIQMQKYIPQTEFLSLICTGDQLSIGGKFGLTWHTTWGWEMKDYIDKQFMNMFYSWKLIKQQTEGVFIRREKHELIDIKDQEESQQERHKAYEYTVDQAFERMQPYCSHDQKDFKDRMFIVERMGKDDKFREELVKRFEQIEL